MNGIEMKPLTILPPEEKSRKGKYFLIAIFISITALSIFADIYAVHEFARKRNLAAIVIAFSAPATLGFAIASVVNVWKLRKEDDD